jgi:hypothetical protein
LAVCRSIAALVTAVGAARVVAFCCHGRRQRLRPGCRLWHPPECPTHDLVHVPQRHLQR